MNTTSDIKARHQRNRKLKSISDQLSGLNKKIELLNNKIFNNPDQDILIRKFELLNKAMQANTRAEQEFFRNQLNTI